MGVAARPRRRPPVEEDQEATGPGSTAEVKAHPPTAGDPGVRSRSTSPDRRSRIPAAFFYEILGIPKVSC